MKHITLCPSSCAFHQGDSISLDALSALEDTLPAAKPLPESPKLRPEDIVNVIFHYSLLVYICYILHFKLLFSDMLNNDGSMCDNVYVQEKQAKSEKGVRVGEREDTLPPDYRFSEEKLKERPAPPKEVEWVL